MQVDPFMLIAEGTKYESFIHAETRIISTNLLRTNDSKGQRDHNR